MENAFHDAVRQRLLSRRAKIVATLKHIEIQRMSLCKRDLAHDDMIEPNRAAMLNSLDDWYHKELNDVDNALARARDSHFGICFGCSSEIDPIRLEKYPEAEFCRSCEDLKKWMEIG